MATAKGVSETPKITHERCEEIAHQGRFADATLTEKRACSETFSDEFKLSSDRVREHVTWTLDYKSWVPGKNIARYFIPKPWL